MKVSLAVGALLLGVYALLRLGFLLSNWSYFEDAACSDLKGRDLRRLPYGQGGKLRQPKSPSPAFGPQFGNGAGGLPPPKKRKFKT